MAQLIIYNEEKDECRFAQVEPDTFALAGKADGSFEAMTYNEWEALRCRQACEQLKKALASKDLTDEKRSQIAGFLDHFNESMQVKYLEGKRSWVDLFTELVDDFTALAK